MVPDYIYHQMKKTKPENLFFKKRWVSANSNHYDLSYHNILVNERKRRLARKANG
jgi:hypothetical protein